VLCGLPPSRRGQPEFIRNSSLDPVALIFSRPGPIVDGFLDFRAVRAGGRTAG